MHNSQLVCVCDAVPPRLAWRPISARARPVTAKVWWDVAYGARTSDVLTVLASQEGERLTVADIVAVLRDRAFALLVVLLGLPNCLPMPPPIPLVCGLLLLLVAIQIAAGMSAPWLPRRLLGQSIRQSDVKRAVTRAVPILKRLERWSRPRLSVFETAIGMRGMGVALLALALALIVAAPLIGQIPLGLAVCLVGLGLVERDGIVVLAGLGVGLFGVAINAGFAYAVIAGIAGYSTCRGFSGPASTGAKLLQAVADLVGPEALQPAEGAVQAVEVVVRDAADRGDRARVLVVELLHDVVNLAALVGQADPHGAAVGLRPGVVQVAGFHKFLHVVRDVGAEVVAPRPQLARGELAVADVVQQQRLDAVDVLPPRRSNSSLMTSRRRRCRRSTRWRASR